MSSGTAEARRQILIAGSGRSGTTWISSVLAECRDAVQVFEPLNQRRVAGVPLPTAFPDCPGIYLRPDCLYPAWEAFFRQLFDSEVASCWTRQDWTRAPRVAQMLPLGRKACYYLARKTYERRAARARVQVIKTIRANLLLQWLARHFPVQVVLVLRHPCAVIASRLRLGWSDSLEGILSQPMLIEDHLQPMRHWIARVDSDVERLAVLWCVETLVPLLLQGSTNVSMHWYESFDQTPDQEFARLFASTRMQPTAAAERSIHRFHSNTCDAVRQGQRDWHAGLGAQRGRHVLDICNAFGLRMYGAACEPLEPHAATVAAAPCLKHRLL